MGILRTDRVTGLGGANAINGSAFFPQNTYINVEPDSDLDLSGDFTVEMWVRNLAGPQIAQYQRQIASNNYYQSGSDGNWYFGFNQNSSHNIIFYSYDGTGSAESLSGTCTSNLDEWYHIAASRSGSTLKLFVNGVEEASGTLSKGLDDGGNNGLFIGGISKSKGTDSWGDHYGWISNLRIIKGRALYTANFTVPTGRLEKTSDTVLLCFQSPGNVLEEKTGKILSHNNHDTTGLSKEVSADRLAPDKGEDHGTTFTDNTKFDTLSYMVPPGGTTAQRGRGRGIIGWGANPVSPAIDFINIQSQGTATRWGSLITSNWGAHGTSSSTRGLFAAGYLNNPNTFFNNIEFLTIATEGKVFDFGNLSAQAYKVGALSNQTRGIFALGYAAPNFALTNVIDFVTIATAGDGNDFGDITPSGGRSAMAACSSTTRGLFAGGQTPSASDIIDFITIASQGTDATDFGNLSQARDNVAGTSSNTRAIFGGGSSPTIRDTIDYVTIASAGHAVDFGNLKNAQKSLAGTSNNTRGIFAGGYISPATTNVMNFVTIATTGNAKDFGDLSTARRDIGGFSDSHGGLE